MPAAEINYKPNRVGDFYVPYISFNEKTRAFIERHFIQPRIEPFLAYHKIDGGSLNNNFLLCDVMFDAVDISSGSENSYLYDEILATLRRNENGKIDHKLMYTITSSLRTAPLVCGVTKVRYGCVKLYNKPILFYIYVDLAELVLFLESHARR